MAAQPLVIGVLLGDPRLPYPYSPTGFFGEDEIEAARQLERALGALDGYRFTYFDDHADLIDALRADPPDLILNLCDTGYRNQWEQERNIPALLEILDLPYTGADAMGIDLTTDKAIVRNVALNQRIPVPNELYVDLAADPPLTPTAYPALIKPNASGGSFGITRDAVVYNHAEAEAYLRWLAGSLQPPEALIQDFLTGAEYTVGVIGNPDTGFTILPPLEVDFSGLDPGLPPILTYGSKCDPASPYWQQLRFRQAELDEITYAQLVDSCTRMIRRLCIRDYARFDFRCGEDGMPRLIDANTNPTWYWNGKMATMAEWAGYDYTGMLKLILETALQRYGMRN